MAENLKHLDDSNFQSAIAKGVTLVDFFAEWCGPCRRIAPIVEEIANEKQPNVTIAKVDIENAQQTAHEYRVTSIPTIIVFKDGKEVKRLVGLTDKHGLVSMIKAVQ